MATPSSFGIIAGNGLYPQIMARAARAAGVKKIVAAAFREETESVMAELVDEIEWMRVGQLGRLIAFFKQREISSAAMAGQINPGNLFNLRPDIKALLILGRLKIRNAETIFGAIGDELAKAGVTLEPATIFMEDYLAKPGLVAGPGLGAREEADIEFGFHIAKEVSRLDIGQTVVVRRGTVLAVEGFEGTDKTILRGGELGKKGAVVVKVSKPGQDFRFDVPVIGPQTLRIAAQARIRVVAIEAGKTLLLDQEALAAAAERHGISIFAGSI